MKMILRRCDGCGKTIDEAHASHWLRIEQPGQGVLDCCSWPCVTRLSTTKTLAVMTLARAAKQVPNA